MTRDIEMKGSAAFEERLLTVEDLAAFLQVPTRTIYQWRHRNQGPRALKAGTLVRYTMKDVLDWLEERAS
jgi:excisionase family DNA binding protein